MTEKFAPFKNSTQSTTVGPGNGLTFENDKESINVYGDFEITKSANSVQALDQLINQLQDIKASISATPKPDKK